MLVRLKMQPVAIAVFLEAIVTFLLVLGVLTAKQGGAVTGVIAGGLLFVRTIVTPVEKVATLLDKPVGAVNELLRKVGVNDNPPTQ